MIRFAIVGHVDRSERINGLSRLIEEHHATVRVFVDGQTHLPKVGAAGNHRRALAAHEGLTGHVAVIEDDALPTSNFVADVHTWVGRFPDDLISLYLGTGHPESWQARVLGALEAADLAETDYIALPKLIHAVCYVMPTAQLPAVLKALKRTGNIDYNIGDAWRRLVRRDVIYPVRSLVDHDDDLPSLLRSHRHPRRAHRLA